VCGIFCVFLQDGSQSPDEARLLEVARILDHRGPDSHGIHSGSGFGLVHTRLSLVDLESRSDQPFRDASGRFALVYNGEIYNFRTLREDLERDGVRFRTTSDTEVLLGLLIARGVDASLPLLEGMFAFALYDAEEESLVIARDLLGIKPLYRCDRPGAVFFTSEIQALRPWFELEPDILSVSAYLQDAGTPTKEFSFFKDVRVVPPGTVTRIRRGSAPVVKTFRSLADLWDPDHGRVLARLKPEAQVDRLDETFHQSVRSQLFADAPVGAFCSGGVDSSLVVAVGSKYRSDLSIFHANVVGPTSETDAATELARHLDLDLKSVEVHPQDFIDWIPKVILHYGFPFSGHPNSVPFYLVSRLVREHGVKGVLTGEGSDECFLGYDKLVPTIGEFIADLTGSFKKKARAITGKARRLRARRLGSRHLVRALLRRFDYELEWDAIHRLVDGRREGEVDPRNLDTLVSLSHHLRTLLHRNDCLGMAASVESRFPFLDGQVLRLAVNLPYRSKIRFEPRVFDRRHPFVVDKWIVRRLADRYLPASLSRRTKRGFPVRAHKQMSIRRELFRDGFVEDLFRLSEPKMKMLFESARQDLKVKLLQLDVWAALFFEGTSPERIADRLRRHVSFGSGRNRSNSE